MLPDWRVVRGVLRKGYGVASGPSAHYPYGALERQLPIFRDRGLDLSSLYRGTLDIDIRPLAFALVLPEFTFRGVHWTDLHPPEDFSFVRCRVGFADSLYEGWIYYPHPETKIRNFQDPSLLEVIAEPILHVHIGDLLHVHMDARRVEVKDRSEAPTGL